MDTMKAPRKCDDGDVAALVVAAREAAEELFIVTRLGTRRVEPQQRWERLVEALKPFGGISEG
ncbi:MAG: hypothetical protein EPO65_01300 [Dehalococcoidia bacterium]|nr:MAG: hypothetical protein EPO65_01300 [Dehalococcoidia bacterium]